MKSLETKGLKSAAELAESKLHGTRLKYLGGCKCLQCRAANSRYQSMRTEAIRRGESNKLISAEPAREHLLALSDAGIGRRTVSDISGVGITTIGLIRTGKRTQCREAVMKAILSVGFDVQHDRTIISAVATHRKVRLLINEGFTQKELAKRLGFKSHSLQLNPKIITAAKALKIARFYNAINAEA